MPLTSSVFWASDPPTLQCSRATTQRRISRSYCLYDSHHHPLRQRTAHSQLVYRHNRQAIMAPKARVRAGARKALLRKWRPNPGTQFRSYKSDFGFLKMGLLQRRRISERDNVSQRSVRLAQRRIIRKSPKSSEATSLDAFRYEELDQEKRQIRLLHLLPGEFDDQISARLSVAYLDNNPDYEALSYVWGDPRFRLDITLNGHVREITVNLWTALRRRMSVV